MSFPATSLTDHLRASALLFALYVGFTCISVPSYAQTTKAIELKSSQGNVVPASSDQKIVSVGGSLTEVAYALGKQGNLVAVDTSSVFPEKALKEKPNVGYMRALSAEGILALDPTLILAEEGAGPPETIDLLQEASIPFVTVPSRYDAQGIVNKITMVGQALQAEEQASKLAEKVTNELDLVASKISGLKLDEKKKVLFLFSMRGGRLMVSGSNTQASAVIEMAGAENAMASFEGFKPVSNEAVLAANPDVILMMSRAGAPMPKEGKVFSHPALSETKAAKTSSLIVMPGMYLLGFGPRTARAIADLADHLYPDQNLASKTIFSEASN